MLIASKRVFLAFAENHFISQPIAVRWRRVTICVWAIVLIAVAIRVLLRNIHDSGVYDAYIGAAYHWLEGHDLYGTEGRPFQYSPLVAVCFTPFALFSEHLGSILWRLLGAGMYFHALSRWTTVILPARWRETQHSHFLLLVLPLSIGSLNNGQANTMLTALILLSLIAVVKDRWIRAGVFIACAIFLKLYPFALALLLLTIFPKQLYKPLLVSLFAGVVLCFLAQSPSYVVHQFEHWFRFVSSDFRTNFAMEAGYRDLRLLLRAAGFKVNDTAYTAIQLVGAAGTAGVCFRSRHLPRKVLVRLIYSLLVCWILLLGPATESSTYILLAPALAFELIEAWTAPTHRLLRAALVLVCILLGIGLTAAWTSMTTTIHAMGEQPLAVVIFACCILYKTKISPALDDTPAETNSALNSAPSELATFKS
jgi:hypothetical protein